MRVIARARRSASNATATGAASDLCSHSAGFGCPVRPDQPVRAEVAVVRLVAEVAAVGPAGRAVGQRLDEAVVPPLPDESALQPRGRLDRVPVVGQRPVELPIACEYSHMISGCRWSPDRACSTMAIERRVHRAGQVADAAGRSSSPSGSRPRSGAAGDGSNARSQAAAASWFVPCPDSLPSDQAMTDGWFLVAQGHPRDALDPLGRGSAGRRTGCSGTRATRCRPRR